MLKKATLGQELEILIKGVEAPISSSLTKAFDDDGLIIYDFEVSCNEEVYPRPITLLWKVPAIDVKGVWKPTTDFAKRIQADWELENMESRISIDSPVISLFGNNDLNVLTFACSNAINKLEMNARLREENNNFYCHLTLFTEQHYALKKFKIQLRLDYRNLHFSDTLRDVSKWWETAGQLKPAFVPPIAKKPLYSTWYQFHQSLDLDVLFQECKIAYDLGYRVVIVDDGWQTNDSNRGYDYTGDWQPDRIPEMAQFVAQMHKLGMKVALWYSVPFCGKKSAAYERFKGKFLTENHRWAPVFDPRYPEVREYLVNTYAHALRDWKLDGFKLDFIDDFKLYSDTPLSKEDGRDFASINAAVDRLLTDVMTALQAINPEVFIEFRQKYTGPAMRKYGNMFRAFDCPGDATMNRVRIADIKMLCGESVVHSDMVTWHKDESLEVAALHMVNTLFGVPQLSIMLHEAPPLHVQMIAFYTRYWQEHAHILLEGHFTPSRPLANYPMQRVSKDGYTIIGIYEEYVAKLYEAKENIHLINGQIANELVLNCITSLGDYNCLVYDCTGKKISEKEVNLAKGVHLLEVPPCGLIELTKQV
ncbi:glycoside hydrolase family 36 protein [Spongiimicrobium sp. 3-5]|uniref:glycoside hydrolase family 36 protein n=1 Tax=Spongiimicrobium sp. 3-5 TaxID=3332596 RepID=UPI00397FB62C